MLAGTALDGLDPELFRARLVALAEVAGRIALASFAAGAQTRANVHWKGGGSPVTDADHAVDAFLAHELPALAPLAYHSEERPDTWRGETTRPAFVVDPIDGTRNFIKGGDVWCIVIGIIDGGRPLAGAVHIPARGMTFSAVRGHGAFLGANPLVAPRPAAGGLRATGARALIDFFARRIGATLEPMPPVPALAHRVLMPLIGSADLALAQSGGHDWDIVASDCILREAGARLVTLGGEAPDYRLSGEEHPALIAASAGILDKIGPALLTNPA